jgi:hypothetical protein
MSAMGVLNRRAGDRTILAQLTHFDRTAADFGAVQLHNEPKGLASTLIEA